MTEVGVYSSFFEIMTSTPLALISSITYWLANELDNPLDFILTGREVNDNVYRMLGLIVKMLTASYADEAYSSNKTLEKIAKHVLRTLRDPE
jgi:hypothetical protein